MTDDELDTEDAVGVGGHSLDPTSVLGHLRDRREQIAEEQLKVIPVPRWSNPEVFVRYRPVEHDELRKAQRLVERAKQNRSAAEVNSNADVLIRACVAVFARLEGRDEEMSLRPGDPTGELTTFDRDLAANLLGPEEAENATARQVLRALFFTDGDILSHAEALVNWSGYRTRETDEQLEGE